MDRFWSRVDSDGPLLSPYLGQCWLWRASCGSNGYGQVGVEGRKRTAHRLAYELVRGPVPNGLVLDHLCRNKRCVNPAHLEPVTNAVNIQRARSEFHCPHGHRWDEQEPFYSKGSRVCRICNRAYYHRRKAKANLSATPTEG